MKQRRPVDVQDYRAGQYFRRLRDFLGASEIESRLARIDNEIRTEKGVYLQQWVIPRRSWWLGFAEALEIIRTNGSFKRSVSAPMERPLQTAVKLSTLHNTFQDWKRDEIRSRILADETLEPILFEIDIASHYWQLGYDIDWIESRSDEGLRSAEFVARSSEYELEVECKAKEADAGRKIERATFYRVIDELEPVLSNQSLMGDVFVTVPGRLPVANTWRRKFAESMERELRLGSGSTEFDLGEKLEFDLEEGDGKAIPLQSVLRRADLRLHPYAHYAVAGERRNGQVVNPILFRLESANTDEFLLSVLDGLRDANRQFEGTRAGIISCHIPEIASFEGLQTDTGIERITKRFFSRRPAADFIYAISYVSEARREEQGHVILSDLPSLTYRNPNYTGPYDDQVPIHVPA